MPALEKSAKITLSMIVLIIIAIGLAPVILLLFRSFYKAGQFDLAFLRQFLSSAQQWRMLLNSLSLASLVALFSLIFGLFLALLLSRTDLPYKTVFVVLFCSPLVLPPYVTAISWFYLTGKNGLLDFLPIATGMPACIWILTISFMPIVMLIIIFYLRMIDPEIEQAAYLEGGWKATLRHVTLPRIIPGIVLSVILVFLLTLGEFGVPFFYHYSVFSMESFIQFSAFWDENAALAAALPLGFITILVIIIEEKLVRGFDLEIQPIYGKQLYLIRRTGEWKPLIFIIMIILAVLFIILPMFTTIIESAKWTAYLQALQVAGKNLVFTLVLSVASAALTTIAGFFLGYVSHFHVLRVWKAVNILTLFLFTLPGTVLGIGFILLWNNSWTNFIYSTPLIIILGLLAQYVAISSRVVSSALAQVPISFEESARMDGADWGQRLWYIVIPGIRPVIIGGWLIVYLFCLRDLGLTMTIYPAGYDTFSVRTFTLMANSPSSLIAALAVINMLFSIPIIAYVFKKV